MATEIVTAKAGTNHVDSEDIGALYAGGFGPGRYALAIGENLKCTMKDANTLVIGTGGLMFDGRFVRVKNAEELTVTNGTQGQWRKDLAVLTYERDKSNNNIETVSWEVVRGTPAASESAAKAPSIETGSIIDGDEKARVAVAEVDLNGLSPTCKLLLSSVRQLTETNKLLDNTRESVSRTDTLYGGSSIVSGSDLNDFKYAGCWKVSNNTIASSVKNCPVKQAFCLRVRQPLDDDGFSPDKVYAVQELITYRNLRYARYYDGYVDEWGAWKSY